MFKSFFGWLFGWDKTPKKPKTPPSPPTPPIDVGTPQGPEIPVDPNGEIELGHLDPIVPALKLTPKMAEVLRPADEVLNVDVMNDQTSNWNHGLVNMFKDQPVDARDEPVRGPYTRGSDAFIGSGMVPVKMIFQGLIQQKAAAGETQAAAVLTPLAEALSEAAWVARPSMQFNVDVKPDNRIVFFDMTDADNEDIETVVFEAGAQNLRLIKQNVHFCASPKRGKTNEGMTNYDMSLKEDRELGWPFAQGFRLEDLVNHKLGPVGASHAGGWSAGFIAGNPIAVISDWGHKAPVTCDYPSHIFAIDYQAGCRDLIPEATLAAYKQNADMWDAFAAMQVQFVGTDTDEARFDHFKYNPLEAHDHASTLAVARKIAELNGTEFNKQYGGFYCAEGQFAVANFGPKGELLIKKSKFGPGTPLHELITTYHAAPGYANMPEDEKRRNPQIGWSHLEELGNANGGISSTQKMNLTYCSKKYDHPRNYGIYLDFISEDIKGWEEYRPKNREGLIARPMSASTIVWATVRAYLPREGVAKAIAQEIGRAYMHAVQKGDVAVQTAVMALTQGAGPATPQGQKALGMIGAQLGGGWLLMALKNEKTKKMILEMAGAGWIEPGNEADKKAVSDLYDKFLAVLADPSVATQAELDQKLHDLDEEAIQLEVTWKVPNKAGGDPYERATLMKFVPPACWLFWAQQPMFGDASCVRYVGTAAFKSYRKASATG